jgi:glycosyltransferase involved in cell wall biosynthesis
MVSVVVVHYNRPRLLAQALHSLANQTHPAERMEVILVDDGSTLAEVSLPEAHPTPTRYNFVQVLYWCSEIERRTSFTWDLRLRFCGGFCGGCVICQAIEYLDSLEAEGSWWAQRGWRVLRQPNRYLGAARNFGWRAARGEWVMFMDDDNVAMPSLVLTPPLPGGVPG